MFTQFQTIGRGIGKVFFLSLLVLATHCTGPDGDPGPTGKDGADGAAGPQGPQGGQGPQGTPGLNADQLASNGFIKGTIRGTRTDGTPYSEDFNFTIGTAYQGFEKINDNLHELQLWRGESFAGSGNSRITLLVENKGQSTQKVKMGVTTPSVDYNGFFMYWLTMVANNKLFEFRTNAFFEQTSKLLPISTAHNATYKFVSNGTDWKQTHNSNFMILYYLTLEDGSKVYFETLGNSTYDFAYVEDSKGVRSTTSTLYGDLLYKYDSALKGYRIYKGTTDLSETVITPADTQEITNYTYDPVTGALSFDYKVNIQALRTQNTTKHAIEVTGSVSAKAYDARVMRIGAK